MTVRALGAEGQAGQGGGREGVRAFQIGDRLGSDRAQRLGAWALDEPEFGPGSATSQLCDVGQVT